MQVLSDIAYAALGIIAFLVGFVFLVVAFLLACILEVIPFAIGIGAIYFIYRLFN